MMWRDGTSIATPGCQPQLTLTGGRATWKPCSGRCCLRLQLSSTQDSFTVCVPHLGWLTCRRQSGHMPLTRQRSRQHPFPAHIGGTQRQHQSQAGLL